MKKKREIKFRIFDPAIKKYLDSKNFQIYADSIKYVGEVEINDNSNSAMCIIQQFTGFEDTKRNEIYEGDIISDWVDTDQGLVKSHKQVFWNSKHGGWCVDDSFIQDKTEGVELWFELHDYDYEVSGNIFDNPNLLLP